jgi:hypothetical protein
VARPKGLAKTGGKPKGYKAPQTLKKEQAREALREVVMLHMNDLLRAQIAHAKGIGHLFTRDKGGKFTKIENEDAAHKLLTAGTEGEDYWIFMKDPSVQAFTDLMNRALDKPKEQEQEVVHKGGIAVKWED